MNFYYSFYLYILSYLTPTGSFVTNNPKLHDELESQLRNSICCENKMRCCKKSVNDSEIEIRALMVRCPYRASGNIVLHKRDIKHPHVLDENEPLAQSEIENCRKKLLLTVKLSVSNGSGLFKSEYLVIDHVYDPITMKNTRILTPYVVKIQQKPILQMYGLKFLHLVNSQVEEEVFNKYNASYKGCDTTSSKPTCGRITYEGKVIPYSQGFCCSCDAIQNARRQPEEFSQYTENVINYSDPVYLLDGIECPRNLRGNEDITQAEDLIYKMKDGYQQKPFEGPTVSQRNRKVSNQDPLIYFDHDLRPKISHDEKSTLEDFTRKIFKRQAVSGETQKRGGQNCADRFTPPGLDPESYHESTHCLRFSDLWYTVHRLQAPLLEHSLLVQVFEKQEDIKGRVTWKDLTKGKMVRVGTTKSYHLDEKTVAIKYQPSMQHFDPANFALNHKSALLLVPEGTQKSDVPKYPELIAGPPEYLVVHASQISMAGDQCDVAGVGFEAFAKQPNRCFRPRGTCLRNQPQHLWKHDYEAEQAGKKGCFFLKHYGILPDDPIRRNPSTKEQYLVFEYQGSYSSTIDLQIKADFNAVLRPESSAKITEVYVDSTSPYKTLITVKITNSGLTSGSFMIKLTDCPLDMPVGLNNIESKPVLIPPQHQHVFYLEIRLSLPDDRFHCSIAALNCKRELVAMRRIRFQKLDRCICTWHCLCSCVQSSEGLKCVLMSLQHYHAAGFQGLLPITTFVLRYTFLDDMLALMIYIFVFVLLVLLLLGLLKGLVGLYFSTVAMWGLDVILDLPKPIKRYHEVDLVNRRVHYNYQGWPVHPDTKQKVRNIARSTEFCTNVVFLFAYPLNVVILVLRRCCCPQEAYRCDCLDEYIQTDKLYSDKNFNTNQEEDVPRRRKGSSGNFRNLMKARKQRVEKDAEKPNFVEETFDDVVKKSSFGNGSPVNLQVILENNECLKYESSTEDVSGSED